MKENAASEALKASGAGFGVEFKSNSTRRQDLVRQWILAIPLATAAAGVALTNLDEAYVEYLRPMFFVGALLITAAMVHQRQVYSEKQLLSERLQRANNRLDTLHRLQFDLNQSLEISQVSRGVLSHVLESLGDACGALWLRSEFDVTVRSGDETDDAIARLPRGRHWHIAAVHGWNDGDHQATLDAWNNSIESLDNCSEAHYRVQGGLPDSPWVQADMALDSKLSSAISIPIRWKDETIGMLAVARWTNQFSFDDADFLREMALVTGPALENSLLYQRTLTRADFDGLTGLLNHRAIQERLTQELARATRARVNNPAAHFGIAVFDLTDFKLFNDTYGHAMGDEVLRIVSRTLSQTFRVSDMVSRYGGDEFLAILPEADSVGTMVIATRVVEAIKSQVFKAADGSAIVIRATCGIAVYPEDGVTGVDLFQAADARLYEAKQIGQTLIPYLRLQPESTPKLSSSSLWGHFGVLDALITAVDNRDHYSRTHSEQTMCYALLIAQELQKDDALLDAVRISGLLYDVGKIGVPDAILRKPGFLNPEEKFLMQQHCRFGAMMVQDVAHRDRVLEGVQSHHEAYDGSGYPDKLAGNNIPWIARLLAVADCFSAMTTDRPYRKSHTPAAAMEELKAKRGTQFDPEIVNAFANVLAPVVSGEKTLQDTLQSALEQCNSLMARTDTPPAPGSLAASRNNHQATVRDEEPASLV